MLVTSKMLNHVRTVILINQMMIIQKKFEYWYWCWKTVKEARSLDYDKQWEKLWTIILIKDTYEKQKCKRSEYNSSKASQHRVKNCHCLISPNSSRQNDGRRYWGRHAANSNQSKGSQQNVLSIIHSGPGKIIRICELPKTSMKKKAQ